MRQILWLALCCCVVLGCPPSPVSPPPDADAATTIVSDASKEAAPAPTPTPTQPPTDACTRACSNLKTLGCPEANAKDGGQSCVEVCSHAANTNAFDFKPDCIAQAKTLADLKTCGTVKCVK